MDITSFIRNSNKPLILDGAMGSLLQQKGIPFDENLWTANANISNPNLVKEIHESYINAGADIISTNTFRTNPAVYYKSNFKVTNKDFIKSAVDIAKSLKTKRILIAGCNPPAEDSYKSKREISHKELEINHQFHIDTLWENGVDFILNETLSHKDEIIFTAEYCNKKNIPFITSLFFNNDLTLLSGEILADIVEEIQSYNPILVSFNCISLKSFEKLVNTVDLKKIYFGFYLNCGSGNYTDKNISCGVTPEMYHHFVEKYLYLNPKIIGSCCGSDYNHTKELRKLIDEVYRD
jgi:homocysteine S-methyltransferase